MINHQPFAKLKILQHFEILAADLPALLCREQAGIPGFFNHFRLQLRLTAIVKNLSTNLIL